MWGSRTLFISCGKLGALLGLPLTRLSGPDLGLDMAEAVCPRWTLGPSVPYVLWESVAGSINTPLKISSVMAELKSSQEEAKHHNSEDGGSVAMATRSNILSSSLMRMGLRKVLRLDSCVGRPGIQKPIGQCFCYPLI